MIRRQPFHIVQYRPWPLILSFNVGSILTRMVFWFYTINLANLLIRTTTSILILSVWWGDVNNEALYGDHTYYNQEGVEWGMIIFITSEIIFFFGFFWTYYHRSLSPNVEIGVEWPPLGVEAIDPFNIPLLNTIILLGSGASITLSHMYMIERVKFKIGVENKAHYYIVKYMNVTISLGLLFTFIQGMEYIDSSYSLSDGIFGSIFFVATGFHGLHVIVGSTFLVVTLARIKNINISSYHHLGFEIRAWYWHFVDVVWIFLYIRVYWWGAI